MEKKDIELLMSTIIKDHWRSRKKFSNIKVTLSPNFLEINERKRDSSVNFHVEKKYLNSDNLNTMAMYFIKFFDLFYNFKKKESSYLIPFDDLQNLTNTIYFEFYKKQSNILVTEFPYTVRFYKLLVLEVWVPKIHITENDLSSYIKLIDSYTIFHEKNLLRC